MNSKSASAARKAALVLGLSGLALAVWPGRPLFENTAPESEVAAACGARSAVSQKNGSTELVLDLNDGTSWEEAQELAGRFGLELKYNSAYAKENALFVASVQESRAAEILKELNGSPLVEAAEPNVRFSLIDPQAAKASEDENGGGEEKPQSSAPELKKTALTPNDPLYKHQWNFRQIGLPDAWRWADGSSCVVAVIDTGVAYAPEDGRPAAEDLAGTKIVKGYDFVNHREEALDDHCHGTHVAGTIAQSTNNGIGVAGIAPKAAIMPVKVLSSLGFGNLSDIADGIRFAADHGANVINMSLGGFVDSPVLENAVRYASDKGVLVVCAAGNESKASPAYPSAYPEALSVSAVDENRKLAWYTNYGEDIDIAAPGGDAREDYNGDGMPDGIVQNTLNPLDDTEQGYYAFQGTSMAAPHVAGTAALLVSQGVNNPAALRRVLTGTAVMPEQAEAGAGYGGGVLSASSAVRWAGFDYGWGRLFCALLLSVFAAVPLWNRLRSAADIVLMETGTLAGSCGLFFLPLICQAEWPGLGPLLCGLPSWDMYLFGAAGHGNPIFYSCLIPLCAAYILMSDRIWSSAAAGLCCGAAGCFVFEALAGSVRLTLIPYSMQTVWLLVNALILVVTAVVVTGDLRNFFAKEKSA